MTSPKVGGVKYYELARRGDVAAATEVDPGKISAEDRVGRRGPALDVARQPTDRGFLAAGPGGHIALADQDVSDALLELANVARPRVVGADSPIDPRQHFGGQRVGLGFASEPIIEQLMKVKDSYNMDRIAIAAATAAIDQRVLVHPAHPGGIRPECRPRAFRQIGRDLAQVLEHA